MRGESPKSYVRVTRGQSDLIMSRGFIAETTSATILVGTELLLFRVISLILVNIYFICLSMCVIVKG